MKNKITHTSLKTSKKELPFTIPDGYFEQFAANIDKQIAPKKRLLTPYRWVYAAAMFGGIIMIGLIGYTVYTNHTPETPLMAEDYYENLISAGVSEDLLVDYILNE